MICVYYMENIGSEYYLLVRSFLGEPDDNYVHVIYDDGEGLADFLMKKCESIRAEVLKQQHDKVLLLETKLTNLITAAENAVDCVDEEELRDLLKLQIKAARE